MAENLANDCSTHLNGDITDSATTITVANSTGFPSANFRIRIDNEIMLVTAKSGNDWTVTRAVEPVRGVQAAAAHTHLSTVNHRLTKAGLENFVNERAFLLKASIPIVHADFKKLPSTPYELIAAPAAGTYIQPVSIQLISDFSGGAYDANTTAFNGLAIAHGTSTWGFLVNTDDYGSVFSDFITNTVKGFTEIPTGYSTFSADWGSDISTGRVNASLVDGANLNIKGFNTANADFAGGNSANTLTVNVLYLLLSI